MEFIFVKILKLIKMKKITLTFLIGLTLTLTSCFTLFDAVAQSSCDPNTICVSSFNSGYSFAIMSCTGDSASQTVEVVIALKHGLPNQSLNVDTRSVIAYDGNGNAYSLKSIEFPNGSDGFHDYDWNIPTNILVKGKLVFRNVLPKTTKMELIEGAIRTKNSDGGIYDYSYTPKFKIRNLPITWK